MKKLTKRQRRDIYLFTSILIDITIYSFIGWLAINGAIEIYFTCFR